MGTTLENGVYLPSEGERNCYAGLKTNWEILDQKVADVTALQQAVAGALHRQIVTQLPTEDIDPNTIYMVLSGTSATENVYNEFMYVNNAWELIGTSATDLTNYYTKAEVDGKLLLKANASDLTSHTGDTTIHVTASDKTKWTNSAKAVVFRYSSTALTPSSTNSNALLDNADNLKVGDKVIDSSGVLFSITAIDTANSTFTIGTALIDLAQDSDVVHKSGNETIGGVKSFSDDTYIKSLNFTNEVPSQSSSSSSIMPLVTTVTYTDQTASKVARINLRITASGDKSLYPHENNQYALGLTSRKWSEVHGVTYYYGSSDVEFSTKFVTTDTAQTITGAKTFSDNISAKKIISNVAQLQINARSNADSVAVIAGADASDGGGIWLYGKNSVNKSHVAIQVYDTNASTFHAVRLNMDGSLTPTVSNNGLGSSSFKWRSFNSLNPSALGMPDLDNGIDISSYITVVATANKESLYTPPSNGWISVALTRTGGPSMAIMLKQGNFASSGHNIAQQNGTTTCNAMLPVKGGVQVSINSALADGIDFAYFYPCLGNV